MNSVMQLFRVFAVVPFLAPLLNEQDVMPKLIEMLAGGNDSAQSEIVGMIEDMLELAEQDQPVIKQIITDNVSLILEALPKSGIASYALIIIVLFRV